MNLFFKQIIIAISFTIGAYFITGCSGGEADYSLEEVQGAYSINFISRANLVVQKDADPVVKLEVSSEYSVTYAIIGGTNSELFDINQSNNCIVYANGIDKDIEFPVDNSNVVIVQVKDINGKTNEQVLYIQVVDDIDLIKPVILPDTITDLVIVKDDLDVFTTISVYNPRGTPVTYSLSDPDTFVITSEGELSLKQAVVYDPTSNNIYDVTVTVTDPETFLETSIVISVTVVATVADLKPTIVSERFDYVENSTDVLQISTYSNIQDTLVYSLGSTLDEDLFNINIATGTIAFNNFPNYEGPLDYDSNNSYEVEVFVVDGNDKTDRKVITITVLNTNDAPYDIVFDSTQNTYISVQGGTFGSFFFPNKITDAQLLATASASDGDLYFDIYTNPEPSIFSMGVNGVLRVDAPPVSADTDYYEIVIEVREDLGETTLETLYVKILK